MSDSDQKDISIVLCGQAGMGVQTVEYMLSHILKLAGYNIFSTKEYMSRIRGGANSTEIRVSCESVRAFVSRIDLLLPFDKGAVNHLEKRITSGTVILADKEITGDFDQTRCRVINVPFASIAAEIGNKIYSNMIAVGIIAGLFKINPEELAGYISKYFAGKSEDIVRNNINAAARGHTLGEELLKSGQITVSFDPSLKVKNDILASGAETVALGAIAGGCNFIAAYPMSPSTGVLTFMAQHAKEFNVLAEQAEDEIGAVNMAIGAWYAGARALASTSGGGFALMVEGLSLAGMFESPLVIHLAQRPAPATGLPTRTEQADLELALYAGHGEFPRIIFAPGAIEEAFYLTQRAFNLADKYQIPVFVLTDQSLIDSYYNFEKLNPSEVEFESHIIKTSKDYKRYELTENGISPRGIPGCGEGLVVLDSDEHDTEGHITEDLDLRTKMVDKRLGKLALLRGEIIPPEIWPDNNYKKLIVCWGSTYNVVKEAIAKLGRSDISLLHYKQVYPLHPDTADYLKKAEEIIIVENNATSQFGKLIKLYTGVDINKRILKYNGLGFSVEEIIAGLEKIMS